MLDLLAALGLQQEESSSAGFESIETNLRTVLGAVFASPLSLYVGGIAARISATPGMYELSIVKNVGESA